MFIINKKFSEMIFLIDHTVVRWKSLLNIFVWNFTQNQIEKERVDFL